MSSPEQVLVGIRYSVGVVVLLVAGVEHVRVAVHERHLGRLERIVLIHKERMEVRSSGQTSQIMCLVGDVRYWWGVGDRVLVD